MSFQVPHDAQQKAETVTTTIFMTVTPTTEMSTRTINRPWTTATPNLWTMRQPYYTEVQAYYPPQPTILYHRQCSKRGGAIAGSFFGGLGFGLIICVIIAWVLCRKIHRLKKILRRAESGLYTIPVGPDEVKVAVPTGRLPADSEIENEPLLGESRTLVDVETTVSGDF
jgi:hypothetical protein